MAAPGINHGSDSLMLLKVKHLKTRGDEDLKKQNFRDAYVRYNEAVSLLPKDPAAIAQKYGTKEFSNLLSNRSLALNNGGRHAQALADADQLVVLAALWPKSHYRRARALEGMGRFVEAGCAYANAWALLKDEKSKQAECKGALNNVIRHLTSSDLANAILNLVQWPATRRSVSTSAPDGSGPVHLVNKSIASSSPEIRSALPNSLHLPFPSPQLVKAMQGLVRDQEKALGTTKKKQDTASALDGLGTSPMEDTSYYTLLAKWMLHGIPPHDRAYVAGAVCLKAGLEDDALAHAGEVVRHLAQRLAVSAFIAFSRATELCPGNSEYAASKQAAGAKLQDVGSLKDAQRRIKVEACMDFSRASELSPGISEHAASKQAAGAKLHDVCSLKDALRRMKVGSN
eukprot:gene28178-31274_t